jgi:hypothetical protein
MLPVTSAGLLRIKSDAIASFFLDIRPHVRGPSSSEPIRASIVLSQTGDFRDESSRCTGRQRRENHIALHETANRACRSSA